MKKQKKEFVPIYLMFGSEPYFIEETIQQIIKETVQEEEREFNVSVYDAEETQIEVAVEDAITPSFFGDKKVVIVRNANFLTGQKLKLEHNLDSLVKYVASPSPFTIFIVVAPFEKLDERKKLTKLLKKQKVVESQALNEESGKRWIADYAKHHGVIITDGASKVLAELVGMNVSILARELDKLMVYGGEEREITEEMVMDLVPKSAEQNVFMLVDYVVKRDIPAAMEMLSDLLHKQEEPIKIVAMLASQFRLLYQVKMYMQTGYTGQQIASKLGVHAFRVKLASQKVRDFSLEELRNILRELAEVDYQMKSSSLEKKLLLELFLLNRS